MEERKERQKENRNWIPWQIWVSSFIIPLFINNIKYLFFYFMFMNVLPDYTKYTNVHLVPMEGRGGDQIP